MEVRYCPDLEMRQYVKAMGAVLTGIDGKMRWVVTNDDGTQFMLRPDSTKPKDDEQQ